MNKAKFYKTIKSMATTGIFLLFVFVSAEAQNQSNVSLSGKVIDAKYKSALIGATVHIKGTTHEVITDEKGVFRFVTGQKVPVTYIISYIGYQTQELSVTEAKPITVLLQETSSQLNEVVVVGYGTQKRSDVTGSVASVPKNVLNQPAVSFDNLLQGAVSGISVTQSSNQPGATATVRIRGGNSISFGNAPLYVIDGFIVYNNNDFTNTGASNGTAVNALSTVNPSDIESIDVLKDASATAIYGSRGANGVILITTKKGKKGTTNVNYGTYVGTQSVSKKLNLLNASQFASLVNDINTSTGSPLTFTGSKSPDSLGAGSDWQSAAFRTALIQNHDLSINGGDEKSRFLISGNYFDQEGVVVNTGFKRYSGRINYERTITDKLKINTVIFGSNSTEDKLTGADYGSINFSGALPSLLQTAPVIPIKNADGSYNVDPSGYNGGLPVNAIQDITATTNRTNISRVLANFSAEYKFTKELTLKVAAGSDVLSTKQNYYAPSTTTTGNPVSGLARVGTSNVVSWLNENTLNYTKEINSKHTVSALVGYSTQFQKYESAVASAQKFPNDLVSFNNLSFAATTNPSASNGGQVTINSFLARVNYSYLHKYNITISERADGSSRLGLNSKWGYFPSVGLSWNATEESFLQPLSKTVSNLKVRLTAGQTGNSEIPAYSSLYLLSPTTYYFGNTLQTGIAPSQLANEKLKWETTTQYNAGIDLGLFKNRISLLFDVYYKKTTDLLLNVPLSLTTGYTSTLLNVGSVQNQGIEFTLNTENIKKKDFSWRSSVIFSANQNKILSLGASKSYFPAAPTGQVSPVIVKEGQPVATFWGYTTNGLLTADDIAKGVTTLTGVSQQVGDQKYVAYNGGTAGKVTTADKHELGSAQPKFTGSFSNNLAYKDFDLFFLFQFSSGNKVFNLFQQKLEITTTTLNASSTLLDRYDAVKNPNGKHPKAVNAPVPQVIDRYIEDGSFIKLKNISLGYTFPHGVVSKVGIKNARLYVSAQNLLTITNYTGYDPEANFYENDNTKQGVDYGVYPAVRSYQVGLNVTF